MSSPEQRGTRGETTEGIQGRGESGGHQGDLPHNDITSHAPWVEPTEQQPTGWWSNDNYYRQVTALQDKIQGTEEQLSLKEVMLRDDREQCNQLEEALGALRRGKQEEDNVTATTGINTSILPEETMSEVRSSITSASKTWLDYITKMCLKHTQKLLEQRRENDISQQNAQALIMDNNKALAAVVETTLE